MSDDDLPPSPEALPERPIESEHQDRFGRLPFVRRLANALVTPDRKRARGVVVGIVGPWGSGKSSVLNLLARELEAREPRPIVVRFDPWLISGRDDLLLQFLSELHAAIAEAPGNVGEHAKRVLDTLEPYLGALGRAIDLGLPGAGAVLEKTLDGWRKRLDRQKGLLDLKAAVGRALAEVPAPVIVLIDELDRIRDEEVRVVAQLVRAVADFPHVSYVLAYDQQRVEEALGGDLPGDAAERRERGRAFLEKVVQLPLQLPSGMTGEIADLTESEVASIFAENAIDFTTFGDRWPAMLSVLAQDVFKTPREVLRASGAFRVMLGMVGNEVDALDLFAFAALDTKFPGVTSVIREKPHEFALTVDTQRSAMFWVADHENKDINSRLRSRFGDAILSDAAKELLGLMFPFLVGRDEREEPRPNAVRNGRPLSTVLRLGLPPGEIPRSEVEKLLCADADAALNKLQQAASDDRLAALIDRAREVYPDVSSPSDAFWVAAARFLTLQRQEWRPQLPAWPRLGHDISRFAWVRLKRYPDDGDRFLR